MLRKEHATIIGLRKSFVRDEKKSNFRKKLKSYLHDAGRLFDVAACKCLETKCACTPKLSKIMKDFLLDQRSPRAMKISSLAVHETTKRTNDVNDDDTFINKKRHKAVVEESESENNTVLMESGVSELPLQYDEDDHSENENNYTESDDTSDGEYANEEWMTTDAKGNQTRISFPTFSRACDRYGITNRSAADLASSILHDISNQVPEFKSFIIDKSKVRREKKKMRKNVQRKQCPAGLKLLALYFDGRKDQSLVLERTEDGKVHKKMVAEEHTSLIQEPGSLYLGHVSTQTTGAANVSDSIFDYLVDRKIDLSTLACVGCDGCPTNTGKNSGIIRRLEEKLQRPLQWVVCQLHSNELGLRHLFEELDGKTTGPSGFSGPIGKSLPSCLMLPVVDFEPIECNLPQVTASDLSTDQDYLLKICMAVNSGECPESLADRDPGTLSHARWLTMANAIARKYIGTADPSPQLKAITEFIMRVYAPMWFFIKCNAKVKDAPINLWRSISLSRYLVNDLRQIIDKVIQTNAYPAHPENIILASLCDKSMNIRKQAVDNIIKARKSSSQKLVRKFVVPSLNFEANHYFELIDWQDCEITEPPLTMHFTDDELQQFVSKDQTHSLKNDIFHLPCHTQAVERCVKDVTAASSHVCGYENRDGFIRTRRLARETMPIFDNKAQYRA